MNVALSGAAGLHAACLASAGDHHTAGIIIAPTLSYMERAYFDARVSTAGRAQPIVEMRDPLDPGRHAGAARAARREPLLPARRPELPNGRSWDDAPRDASPT